MDDIALARALHVVALVHWIGGVTLVSLVILPAVARLAEPQRRFAVFEEIERRFSRQAKVSVMLAGLTGLYMTHRMDAWRLLADPQTWWLPAMVLLWTIFAFVLFIAEPYFLHDWFRRRAARDPERSFALILRAHLVLTALSLATIAGAVVGVHGGF